MDVHILLTAMSIPKPVQVLYKYHVLVGPYSCFHWTPPTPNGHAGIGACAALARPSLLIGRDKKHPQILCLPSASQASSARQIQLHFCFLPLLVIINQPLYIYRHLLHLPALPPTLARHSLGCLQLDYCARTARWGTSQGSILISPYHQ